MTTTLTRQASGDDNSVIAAPAMNLAAMFERLALNPDLPVEKLRELMEMQRSILREQAERAFNDSMAQAQAAMRRIAADGYNNQTRSRYATYAALDRELRPIYTAHGFALSFDTSDIATAETVRVLCYVTHAGGHTRTYRIDMPSDGKGAKGGDVMTRTHATGSATQYGMRYLLKMIFNVAIGDDADDDGNAASAQQATKEPDGYDDWSLDIKAAAEQGMKVFQQSWKDSKPAYRDYLAKRNPQAYSQLKKLAQRRDGEQ